MTDDKNPDLVNHPSHYGGDAVYEHIKVMEAILSPEQFIGYCRGNATKYLFRAGRKGSQEDADRDLEKARFYVDYEIEFRKRMRVGQTGEWRVPDLVAKRSPISISEFTPTSKVKCKICGADSSRCRHHGTATESLCSSCGATIPWQQSGYMTVEGRPLCIDCHKLLPFTCEGRTNA